MSVSNLTLNSKLLCLKFLQFSCPSLEYFSYAKYQKHSLNWNENKNTVEAATFDTTYTTPEMLV